LKRNKRALEREADRFPSSFLPTVAMYHSVKEIAAAFRVSGQVDGKAITAGAVNGKKRQ